MQTASHLLFQEANTAAHLPASCAAVITPQQAAAAATGVKSREGQSQIPGASDFITARWKREFGLFSSGEAHAKWLQEVAREGPPEGTHELNNSWPRGAALTDLRLL